MFRLLAVSREKLCVCEFVDSLQERQYNVSRHLKVLENTGLLRGEKEGRWTYYGLDRRNPTVAPFARLVTSLLDPEGTFVEDEERFKGRMALRERGKCRCGIQTPALAK
jgi:ArsR family transcriptional regulator